MVLPKSPQDGMPEHKAASDREGLGGSVTLFLRLWSYSGRSQSPSGLQVEQDPAIAELISSIIHDGTGVIAERQPELWSARFDGDLQALSAAKALQQRFLTFHREAEPQQVVPSILICGTKIENVSSSDAGTPEDMLANVTSAQILIAESVYERVKDVPGFEFNPRAVREAGETFGPEAIYELLWTDESTYGHLRQASQATLKSVGRYQIQEELGRGAMGAVYKAYDQLIDRTVALKTISIDRNTPDRDDLISRLKQEAKTAGGLDHPNIITIYDVGQEDEVVYLSMQYVKGTTLAALLTEAGVPSLTTFISWADQICSAVGFAHARGVIHRDLKPANLMVTEDGVIKVLDFGIAKIENTSLTQTGLVVGTPSYMSPEQVAGKKVDQRADIFALGSVFYELLTCEKPFRGDVTTVLYKIVYEDPVAPALVNPAVPGGIDAVIRKALAKDPKQRFQTCEEMRKAILEHATGSSATVPACSAGETAGANALLGPAAFSGHLLADAAPRRSRRMWPIAGTVLLALVIATWALYGRSHSGVFSQLGNRLAGTVQATSAPISNSVDREQSSGQQAHAGVSDQKSESSNSGAGSGATPGRTNTAGQQAQESGEGSGAATTASQEDSASGSDGANLSAVSTPAPSANGADAGVAASSAPAQQRDRNPFVPQSASSPGAAESQTAATVASTRTLKQPKPEPAVMVDGFSRRDVPELLRQAETAAERGNYRLARYEYNLILKLERGNAAARSGLRHVDDAEGSH
jgi:serine/threonine-protein kinase